MHTSARRQYNGIRLTDAAVNEWADWFDPFHMCENLIIIVIRLHVRNQMFSLRNIMDVYLKSLDSQNFN